MALANTPPLPHPAGLRQCQFSRDGVSCDEPVTHTSTWSSEDVGWGPAPTEILTCPTHARRVDARCLELGEPATMRPIARAA